jgi:hypothetical protein
MISRVLLTMALILSLVPACRGDVSASLPPLVAEGKHLVDRDGSVVQLRGVNLGNWLLIEPWMLRWFDVPDQHTIRQTLVSRFGTEFADHFFARYRQSYMRAEDFAAIRAAGFNCVRLPIDYRLLVDDAGQFRDDSHAYERIDFAIDQAAANRLYVVLDLHGAPGGQSDQMHTGRTGQNRLWTDPAAQQLTVEVWRKLADRYKSRPNVVALDLLNEPWGDHHSDIRVELDALCTRLYHAIRETGNTQLILFPGAFTSGVAHYGNLHAHGMTQVGYTDHFYPGLYGDPSTVSSLERFLVHFLPAYESAMTTEAVPMLVGEFNVVLDSSGGGRMMRQVRDAFEARGWSHTMWSYKAISQNGGVEPDNWYVVTNAAPFPELNLQTASRADVEAWLSTLESATWVADEQLIHHMNRPAPVPYPMALDEHQPTYKTSPLPTGWDKTLVGGAAGHVDWSGDVARISATGRDINATADEFLFLSRASAATDTLSITLDRFHDTARYAKAGVMIRWPEAAGTIGPGDAFAMLNLFPDGTLAWMTRDAAGATTTETKRRFPGVNSIRLSREPGKIHADAWVGNAWVRVGSTACPADSTPQIGVAVCGNSLIVPASVQLRIDADPKIAQDATAETSLLSNASFEDAGDQPDRAATWQRWGNWINREDSWTPTKSGQCVLGYHHWRIENADDSGVWQDVKVEAGKTYRLVVPMLADPGENPVDSVTVALEATVDGRQVTLVDETARGIDLQTSTTWSGLSIQAVAPADTIRVLIRVRPKKDAPRGGAVKFDDVHLGVVK